MNVNRAAALQAGGSEPPRGSAPAVVRDTASRMPEEFTPPDLLDLNRRFVDDLSRRRPGRWISMQESDLEASRDSDSP
jgi:hypothetical protein